MTDNNNNSKEEMMKRFLAKGKSVEKCKPGYPINVGSLDKSRKPGYTKDDIKKGKKGKAPMPDYSTYKKGSYHDCDLAPTDHSGCAYVSPKAYKKDN